MCLVLSHSKDESDEQEELLYLLKTIDNRVDSIQHELSMLSAASVTGLIFIILLLFFLIRGIQAGYTQIWDVYQRIHLNNPLFPR